MSTLCGEPHATVLDDGCGHVIPSETDRTVTSTITRGDGRKASLYDDSSISKHQKSMQLTDNKEDGNIGGEPHATVLDDGCGHVIPMETDRTVTSTITRGDRHKSTLRGDSSISKHQKWKLLRDYKENKNIRKIWRKEGIG